MPETARQQPEEKTPDRRASSAPVRSKLPGYWDGPGGVFGAPSFGSLLRRRVCRKTDRNKGCGGDLAIRASLDISGKINTRVSRTLKGAR